MPAKSGGEVWTKPIPDGNTAAVRLDPAKPATAKKKADEVDHAHKEIVPTTSVANGNYKTASAALDDSGAPRGDTDADRRAKHIPIK